MTDTININQGGREMETKYEMYLDYVNNFLTVAAFAEHYRITEAQALTLINYHSEATK